MKPLRRLAFTPFLVFLLIACGDEPDTNEIGPGADGCAPDDLGCLPDKTPRPSFVRPVCTPEPSGAPIDRDTVLQKGEHEVALVRSIEWTRPSKCYEGTENRDCDRKLVFDLRYPAERDVDDELIPVADPVPLLIYNHGFMSSRAENPKLLELLASRGIASIAVQFPLTSLGSVAEIGDVVNQPADVSALIDWALGEITDESSQAALPAGLEFDASKILVGGVSLGGMTSLLTSFHREAGDERIALGFGIVPPGAMFLESFYEERAELPFLLLAGTSDAIVRYELSGEEAFGRMGEGAAFISIEGGTHIGVTEQGFLFAHHEHPDGSPCGLLGFGDSDVTDGISFGRYGVLGGKEVGIDPDATLGDSCSFDDLPPAIAPHQQLAIVQLAVISFIESRLNGNADYDAYLREGLEAETCWARYTPPAAD